MKLNIREGAIEDLKEMNKQIQKHIRDEIQELKHSPLGEDTSLVSKQGLKIYRLKLKSNGLDHRIFFDLDGREVIILGVEHRDKAYTPESIRELKSRL